jgi:hypothetical protein
MHLKTCTCDFTNSLFEHKRVAKQQMYVWKANTQSMRMCLRVLSALSDHPHAATSAQMSALPTNACICVRTWSELKSENDQADVWRVQDLSPMRQ